MRRSRAWSISGRSHPSDRGYLRVTTRYQAGYNRWVAGIVRSTERVNPLGPPITFPSEYTRLSMLPPSQGGPPIPPTAAEITAANTAAARQSARGARAGLRRAGAPREAFTRLGIVDGFEVLNATDLVLGGVEAASLEVWASDGVALIQKLNATRAPIIQDRILEAVTTGERWEAVRETVSAEMGVRGRHLNLIARDQVAKLNGKITEDLQAAAGVTEFIWRSSGDGWVRETHEEANGKTFKWSEGAPDTGFYGESGLPGQAGNCRCTAEPVLPAWMNV